MDSYARGVSIIDDRIRSRPVDWSDEHGGHWMLSRYDLVTAGLRDTSLFRSGRPFLDTKGTHRFIPLTMNGEEHQLYRAMLNPLFRPSLITPLEPEVRAIVRKYLDPFLARGGGDFQTQIAEVAPLEVLCVFLGLDRGMIASIDEVSISASRTYTADELDAIDRRREAFVAELVEDRKRHPRSAQDDFFSALLASRIDGRALTDEELVLTGKQMISAGHGTTTAAMTAVMHAIATDPRLLAGLRAGVLAVGPAVEEILRLAPPLDSLGRNANIPDEVDGVAIGRDDLVGMSLAGANRDPAEFPRPDRAEYDRQPNRHVTFGLGAHACVGAPLARLELRVLVEELLATGLGFVIADEPVRSPVRTFRFVTLPIRTLEDPS